MTAGTASRRVSPGPSSKVRPGAARRRATAAWRSGEAGGRSIGRRLSNTHTRRSSVAAQADHVGVERVVPDDRALRPGGGDELAAADDVARAGRQGGEDPELGGGEADGGGAVAHCVAGGVEHEIADIEPGGGAAATHQ